MTVLDLALVALGLAFALGIVRVVLGPTVADRAVATDLCLFTVIGAVALMAPRTGAEQFEDVVLIAVLLGFVATIALAALIGKERE
ncbi:MAG: monovalent cation/H+ antiporter complex subunit F [Nitriliruptor sp.]|uniref:monovalent cation/H+ antiporter complex subunit F n=1 Tax=Nitriliruptor sp. TaxID=2448056 RepID=UPI0034A089C5